ncbi:MAG: HipA domain-containing protein [Galactobacter sp.]
MGTTGLGGARPKVSVRLEDGSLAIAKFPHGSHRWDVMAWEATALDLLEVAGIRVPQRRLARAGERSVLILRRFDRADDGRRIGYIRAMTALSAVDGEQYDYAEIAEAMRDLSLSPRADHRELFGCVIEYSLRWGPGVVRLGAIVGSSGSWSWGPVVACLGATGPCGLYAPSAACIGRAAEGVIWNGTEDQGEAGVAPGLGGLVGACDRVLARHVP